MKKLALLLLASIIMASCEKKIFETNNYNSPTYNFECFWKEFDRNYAFFEYSHINWDSVKKVYEPQISDKTSDADLFNVLSNMINSLKDGHCNIFSPYGTSQYNDWYLKYPDNGQIDTLIQMQDNSSSVLYGKILHENIGYIQINTFTGNNSDFTNIDKAIAYIKDMKSVIVDVRSNGGGNSDNADIVAGRFADSTRYAFSVRYRNGPNHGDFTEWAKYYLSPAGKTKFIKPIALLTNRKSFSSAEWFILKMKSLPYLVTIGDTTGGGSGNPLQKDLPNGWAFRLSNSQKIMPNGRDYQGVGIFPDIPVWNSQKDEDNNFDRILRTAINYLNNKTK